MNSVRGKTLGHLLGTSDSIGEVGLSGRFHLGADVLRNTRRMGRAYSLLLQTNISPEMCSG